MKLTKKQAQKRSFILYQLAGMKVNLQKMLSSKEIREDSKENIMLARRSIQDAIRTINDFKELPNVKN